MTGKGGGVFEPQFANFHSVQCSFFVRLSLCSNLTALAFEGSEKKAENYFRHSKCKR
jgi:hypothetical protein